MLTSSTSFGKTVIEDHASLGEAASKQCGALLQGVQRPEQERHLDGDRNLVGDRAGNGEAELGLILRAKASLVFSGAERVPCL